METPNFSIFFFPFYTASHILPMVDTARLFAAHAGVIANLVTTHRNALLFENTVNLDIDHGSHIVVHKLDFPCKQVGLPEGVENLNSTTSPEMNRKVFMAVGLLRQPMEQLLRDYRPDCIVSDMFFPWTVDVAEELGIPRVHFNPTGYFPRCVLHSLKTYAPHDKVESEAENFDVPGLPDPIQMKRSQLAGEVKSKTGYALLKEKMEEAETRSYGTIMNSFSDLEPAYIQYFQNVKRGKFWTVAPMSLFCRKSIRNGESNNTINRDQYDFFSWLDSQKPNSVLYVCFGSMVRFSAEQLKEIAMALEASGKLFLWVCRPPENIPKGEEWLPEGFEERIRERNVGFLIKGWAPQVLILDHPSVAGFMNHCGWSSVLEAVTAGVALITWPLFAEHFYNEKLIVDVLKTGIEVGSEYWNEGFSITTPTVTKDKIQNAVCRFMSGSGEAEEMRRRAKELKRMANKAVEEGGSSHLDFMALISELKSAK
ncbi:soyasapogenol B glucuronide galactosyltransferase-like [Momordica charantia]|uniref:Soyasapogenol B glucuronide galactosyltransferase-like n=1 Tax=Momordica charantia TaxID=3673 RepID=A0A6J1CLI5_MOMCH|nr:soyasapogenol B glucuronide galactosyltransferase-like [Momordica charantia]